MCCIGSLRSPKFVLFRIAPLSVASLAFRSLRSATNDKICKDLRSSPLWLCKLMLSNLYERHGIRHSRRYLQITSSRRVQSVVLSRPLQILGMTVFFYLVLL